MMSKSCGAGLLIACLAGACASSEFAAARAPEAMLDPVAVLSARVSPSQASRSQLNTVGYGTTRVLLGLEQLDTDYWEPIDHQGFLAVESAFESEDSWIGAEWGVAFNSEKDSMHIDVAGTLSKYKVDMFAIEGYAGVHRTFMRQSSFQPYFGAGVSATYMDAKKSTDGPTVAIDDDDEGGLIYGAYAHGGISVQVSENMQLGLDLRELFATKVRDLGGEGDIDHTRIAFFVGFGG